MVAENAFTENHHDAVDGRSVHAEVNCQYGPRCSINQRRHPRLSKRLVITGRPDKHIKLSVIRMHIHEWIIAMSIPHTQQTPFTKFIRICRSLAPLCPLDFALFKKLELGVKPHVRRNVEGRMLFLALRPKHPIHSCTLLWWRSQVMVFYVFIGQLDYSVV